MKQIGGYINKIRNSIYRYYYKRRQKKYQGAIEKICLLYYIPDSNVEKYKLWEDGFTKALDLLARDFHVEKINLFDKKPRVEDLNKFDLVIAKSCWNWIVDKYLRNLKELKARRAIMVSCSIPPTRKTAFFYDIVWYETDWYKKFVDFHPNHFQAFGINSDLFRATDAEKDIDVLSVGTITGYKRFHKLNNLPGNRKVILGDTNAADYHVQKALLDPAIEIIPYVSQQILSDYINRAKLVYIPCELDGGGERAVLEAISCGAKVQVETDNPKLVSLLKGNPPITKYDYYFGLINGIDIYRKKIFATHLIIGRQNLKVGRYSFYNRNFRIKGSQKVTIGSFCSFGENVTFITENHDTNFPCTQGYLYRKYLNQNHPGESSASPKLERTKGEIKIGNDVWIGDNVTILSGVSIGNGACIGTGSIVTKDVSAYSISGGIPAKQLKFRFPQEHIDFLEETQWWLWSENEIRKNAAFFKTNFNITTVDQIKNIIK